MEGSEDKKIINLINYDLLLEITKELNQIIEYIQNNLMNQTNKNLDLGVKEVQKKIKVKFGVKKKGLIKFVENEEDKDKNEINLNENEDKKKIKQLILKNKKLKTKIKKFKRHSIEIIKKAKDILLKISDNKNVNLGEFNINSVQELNYANGRYIGNVHCGLREGKGIIYFNNGDRYEGDWKNDKKEGKGIFYFNNGDRYEGDFKNDTFEGKGIYYYIIIIMVIDMKAIIKMIKGKEKE